MTFFCGDFCDNLEVCARMIDLFCSQGWASIMKLCLALLSQFKHGIMAVQDICDVNKYMMTAIKNVDFQRMFSDSLLFNVTANLLQELELDFFIVKVTRMI